MTGLLESWNSWITDHQALVVAVGVPLLTTLAAGTIGWATNRANLLAQRKHRALEQELRLAEFRQAWIDSLRSDFSAYAGLHTQAFLDFSDSNFVEMITIGSRILMRMNQDDPDFSAVETSIKHAIDRASTQRDEFEELEEKYKGADSIVVIGRRVLKREWERLKEDLRKTEK